MLFFGRFDNIIEKSVCATKNKYFEPKIDESDSGYPNLCKKSK